MIWDIDPILLNIGPLEIRYYGVFFAIALLGSYFLAQKLARLKGLSLEKLDILVIYLFFGLILGARFGHIIFYELNYYLAHPIKIIEVWNGGLASHGAAIGLMTAYLLFIWRHKKVKFWDYADIISVVAAIPIALIRLGNFFNSEIIGRAWDGPWAVTFKRVDDIARHPSQIYEFLIGTLVFTILLTCWKKFNKKVKPGFFFGLLFTLYFPLRFFVEFFKEYQLHENLLNLTTGQLLSIPFFLLGVTTLYFTQKR